MIHTVDHEQEKEDLFEEQQREADREKSLRAREQFEKQWEENLKESRRVAGLCVFCGQPLTAIARLAGHTRHSECTTLVE
jgi:hypothetical protein